MRRWQLLPIAVVLLATGPAGGETNDVPAWLESLRLNQVQVIGSHNSYHRAPSAALDGLMVGVLNGNPEAIDGICPGDTTGNDCVQRLRYSHAPLDEQLGDLGLRQFELDVFHDPRGATFARPLGWVFTAGFPPGGEAFDEALREPGFKVFHIQDLDFRSNCYLLLECLAIVRDWSLANSDHYPVLILIETKDTPLPEIDGFAFARPPIFGNKTFQDLDRDIRSVFEDGQLLTPDDVRGAYPTLRQAVLEAGWPTLADSRGKIIFALDNGPPHRSRYLSKFSGLEGAVMFTDSPIDADEAAFVKRNDPAASDIPDLVRAGFLVRTRADVETQEALYDDATRRDQAFASGAHYVSTDYRVPDPSLSDYSVAFEGDRSIRCNPLLTDAECSFTTPDRVTRVAQLRCNIAKQRAVARDASCRLRRAALALRAGSSVDYAACAARLSTAFERAEARYGVCTTTDDASERSLAIGAFVAERITAITATTAIDGGTPNRCAAYRSRALASHVRCETSARLKELRGRDGQRIRERCDAALERSWVLVLRRYPDTCAETTAVATFVQANREGVGIGAAP
jgi:hypothetical protein